MGVSNKELKEALQKGAGAPRGAAGWPGGWRAAAVWDQEYPGREAGLGKSLVMGVANAFAQELGGQRWGRQPPLGNGGWLTEHSAVL